MDLAEIRAQFKTEEIKYTEMRGSFRCFEAQICVPSIPLAEFWMGSLGRLIHGSA